MYKNLTIVLAVILLALIADRVIFTSTDIKIEMHPEVLKASHNSELSLQVYRTNILGFKTPFSSVQVKFLIEEGPNLIELIDTDDNGTVTVRSKGIEGEAVIGIYSEKSGLQLKKILIKILPRDVA
jgi:hypothetical protein